MIAPLLLLLAQNDRLPPANALPPPGTVEAAVMAPVDAVFAAIAASDGERMREAVRADGNLLVATEAADGTRKLLRRTMADFIAGLKPGGPKLEERLYNPAIEIDGDVAFVWGRYNFYIDGKLHHCGYDLFDLVRDADGWRVANITYSSRTTGCEG